MRIYVQLISCLLGVLLSLSNVSRQAKRWADSIESLVRLTNAKPEFKAYPAFAEVC